MDLLLLRFSDAHSSTAGLLFADKVFEAYGLEDEYRTVKVPGETRIPDGRYEIKYRKVISPLTQKYRARFPLFFSWHLEICDVPGFTCVYMHVGNRETETDGCLLVGDTLNNNQIDEAFLGNSGPAFERVYRKLAKVLDAGGRVFIDVRTLQC